MRVSGHARPAGVVVAVLKGSNSGLSLTVARQAVTGAFSFTGRYIARRLLDEGEQVITLTGHPRPELFDGHVRAVPYDFEDPAAMMRSLAGVDVLYNTYWVRFPHAGLTFSHAVRNSRILIECARQAGVRRVVQITVAGASRESPFPYFRGKALVEQAVRESGLSYAILRPTLAFGREDILVNNIAWLLRRMPVFVIPGSGAYRVQPVYAGDIAEVAVEAGKRDQPEVIEVGGPEVLTYIELVHLLAKAVGSRAKIVHAPRRVAAILGRILGFALRDVLITDYEIGALMSDLLVSESAALGKTSFREWVGQNAQSLGRQYHSELARHFR